MIQASPVTKEIGVQTDIALPNSNHLAVEFDDDDDDMPTDSDHSDIEDSDIEWTFPDQDSDEGDITPETKNDMNGDTKFIVYKSSLEHLLPTHCLNCGINFLKTDYTWNVLGT